MPAHTLPANPPSPSPFPALPLPRQHPAHPARHGTARRQRLRRLEVDLGARQASFPAGGSPFGGYLELPAINETRKGRPHRFVYGYSRWVGGWVLWPGARCRTRAAYCVLQRCGGACVCTARCLLPALGSPESLPDARPPSSRTPRLALLLKGLRENCAHRAAPAWQLTACCLATRLRARPPTRPPACRPAARTSV